MAFGEMTYSIPLISHFEKKHWKEQCYSGVVKRTKQKTAEVFLLPHQNIPWEKSTNKDAVQTQFPQTLNTWGQPYKLQPMVWDPDPQAQLSTLPTSQINAKGKK